jgi:hypothetical protein
MNIYTNQEIADIRWALSNINLNHWKENYTYGYNYLNKYESANKAGSILYKNNIQKFIKMGNLYEHHITDYLNKCENINKILEVVYENNMSFIKTEECFNDIILFLKEKINNEQLKFERQIEALENKNVKEL